MKWSLAIVAPFALACAHRGAAPPPPPPPPPPATVTSHDIGHESPVSLQQLLAGRIAGVIVTAAPGGGISVRMGGPTSFYSAQEPLIVVDGVPFEGGPGGTLTWLNPQDI